MLQCVAVRSLKFYVIHVIEHVLQCVALCCSVLQCVTVRSLTLYVIHVIEHVLQCVAVCCSVSQCVAVCCSAFFDILCHTCN